MADAVDAVLASAAPRVPVDAVDQILGPSTPGDAGPISDAPSTASGPGLGEASARGLKQGVTLGWGDEIEGVLRHAFTDEKYSEARDRARQADEAARKAHPWGFGLSQVVGNAATGLATGGVVGAAAKLGTLGATGLAGAEGATQSLGESGADLTKGEYGEALKDTAIGGATSAVAGAALSKLFGTYADTAVARRAKHLTEDISEGAVPTVKRRLGQVTMPDESGKSLAVDVLDSDHEFTSALKAGKAKALDVVKNRLDAHNAAVTPAYGAIDEATGGVPFRSVRASLDSAIDAADLPGNSNVRDALVGTKDDFAKWVERHVAKANPGVEAKDLAAQVDDAAIPTQDVRGWVSKLLKRADQSMGSLSETERKVVKDKVHDVAHGFLKGYLGDVAAADPSLAQPVSTILESNRRARVYSAVKDALEKSAQRKNWSPSNLGDTLSKASLPGVAAVIAGGANIATGGAAFAATKAAQSAGRAANRGATFYLSQLVRAARAGGATPQMALDAIKAGVPQATVMSVLGAKAALAPAPVPHPGGP